jgi:hypothetical protein
LRAELFHLKRQQRSAVYLLAVASDTMAPTSICGSLAAAPASFSVPNSQGQVWRTMSAHDRTAALNADIARGLGWADFVAKVF